MSKSAMRRLRFAALAAALLLSGAAQAASGEYIFDIAKRDARLVPLWSGIVPPAYAREPWIKRLEGTTIPVERVVVGGKPFYLGSVCKPHDCGGNTIVFLIAVDRSECYGLLASETLKVANQPFGFPPPQALQMMQRFLNR